MSQNPINLGLRFILELVALFAVGYGGWHATTGVGRYLLAVGLPLLFAFLWGGLRPPDEPHHPTKPPVPVSGKVRLLVEVIAFAGGIWGFLSAGATVTGWVFAAILLIHYVLSYDRVAWLLRH